MPIGDSGPIGDTGQVIRAGNFIFGYSSGKDNLFVDYTPAASSQNSAYPDDNLKIYQHTSRPWKSLVTTQVTITLTFAASKSIVVFVLLDCNFSSVLIDGQAFTLTMDSGTGRYDLYAAKAYTGSAPVITIPAQTPTDGAAFFRIGTVVCLDTLLTFSKNPSFPYERSYDEEMISTKTPSGKETDILMGEIKWTGSFGFDRLKKAYESELLLLGRLKKNAFLIFYENFDDTSKVYICRRRSVIESSWSKPKTVDIKTITFEEVY
jgi:hypothetical protein